MSLMFALQDEDPAELAPGTRLLNGLYQIVEPLQHGGFAMTYVARDSLERHVVIKECFPSGICERVDGLVRSRSASVDAQFMALKQQFLREAHGVATLKHPHVVAVHQVFEENNTAYMVLDYVAGMDLISLLEDEPERLTAGFLERTLRETLKAVRHIHANGILHRDIAPDNIRVDAADRITLIDFGAASARSSDLTAEKGLVPAVKDGYSPPEFYSANDTHDCSSDLYSVAATFYHLITGEPPLDGLTRSEAVSHGAADPYAPLAGGDWTCGHHILSTIDMALQLSRDLRPQSAELWVKSLDELPSQRPVVTEVRELDPALETAISTLVRDVNKTIVPTSTGLVLDPAHRLPKAKEPASPKKKQWVDVTGNPIFDLESWIRQQEAETQPVQPVQDLAEENLELDHATLMEPDFDAEDQIVHATPERKSFIAGLLSRCFSRSPAAFAT
jgi:serine/threonine protein kinase